MFSFLVPILFKVEICDPCGISKFQFLVEKRVLGYFHFLYFLIGSWRIYRNAAMVEKEEEEEGEKTNECFCYFDDIQIFVNISAAYIFVYFDNCYRCSVSPV